MRDSVSRRGVNFVSTNFIAFRFDRCAYEHRVLLLQRNATLCHRFRGVCGVGIRDGDIEPSNNVVHKQT